MQERHSDGERYFNELAYSTEKYIIPYISQYFDITENTKVLEIGCGAGGNLAPFIKRGCRVTGFDLSRSKIEKARQILDVDNNPHIQLFSEDVFEVKDLGLFDIIFVRDVIEHIPNKAHFFEHIKDFLKKDGVLYFGFPAWYMPFGGHQQICKNKLLSHMPFYHILPKFMYKSILSAFGEDKYTIDELLSIKECQITIEQFRRFAKQHDYQIYQETFFFINPHYEVKFKLQPRLLSPILAKIPFVRNFFTTGCFYLLKLKV